MTRERIGIQIGASTAPGRLSAIAAESEALGYGEMWLAEDYFSLGGIASAAAALAATERMSVGLGVVAGPVRHPAVTAMEFATLAGVHPGRFMGGIGHGAPGWLRQMGVQPESPMGSLREALYAIRALLNGVDLTSDGDYFSFDAVRLSHAPGGPLPLYLGVHGPASLRLSGELADGTLLGWFSSPGYLEWARQRIDEGREAAGGHRPHQLVALCVLSISEDDPAAARRKLYRFAVPMLEGMQKSPQLARSVTGIDPRDLLDEARRAAMLDDPPPQPLADFVAFGDFDACAASVARLFAAGADRVVLVPNPAGLRSTADMVDQMRTATGLLRSSGDLAAGGR